MNKQSKARSLLMGASYSVVTLVMSMSVAGAVHAQTRGEPASVSVTNLDEVIVTARRRAERVQDVPGSIQAFTGQKLEDLGVGTLAEILALTPGVQFLQNTGIAGQGEIVIRGGGSGRGVNADGATGIYYNGAYIAGGNTGGRIFTPSELFDVERVEVLKGPQGALYGRNSLGGAINMVSRRPALGAAWGQVTVGVADRERVSLEANGDVTLIPERLGVRVGFAVANRSDGFYDNAVLGRAPDRFDSIIARAVIRAKPTETSDLVLQLDQFVIDQAGRLNADLDLVGDPFILIRDDDNRGRQELQNIALTSTTDLSWGSLTVIASRRERETTFSGDIDQYIATPVYDPLLQIACIPAVTGARPVPAPGNQRCTEIQHDDFTQNTFEVRLAGETSGVRWLVGADRVEGDDVFTTLERGRGANAFLLDSSNTFTSQAVFGSLETTFQSRLTVGVDVRRTADEKRSLSRATRTEGATAGTVLFANDFPFDFENTSYATFARFAVTPSHSVYARYGTGFRAGGLNIDGRDLVNPVDNLVVVVPDFYDPEDARSYEVGAKTQWFDRHLTVNVIAFRTEYNDLIQNSNNGLTGLNRVSFLTNTGDAQIDGVELEVVLARLELLGGRIDLSANGAYLDSEVLSGTQAGRAIAGVSDYSTSAVLQYARNLSDVWDLTGSLRYNQQWGGFTDPQNIVGLQEPQTFDLTLGVKSDAWEVQLEIPNLTDEDEPINNTTANVIVPRTPRTWLLRVVHRFGG